jgi:hypothetical protein
MLRRGQTTTFPERLDISLPSRRRTVKLRDCGSARLLNLDSAQMASTWSTPRAHRSELSDGPPSQGAAEHAPDGYA